MNAAFGLLESDSPLGLLDAEEALPGVVTQDVTDGDHFGSGLQTSFALGAASSLQFAVMTRVAATSPRKPR